MRLPNNPCCCSERATCYTGEGHASLIHGSEQVPIPDHLDLYHLAEEVAPTDRTALETVSSQRSHARLPTYVVIASA